MTNFEKWTSGLKPEDLFNVDGELAFIYDDCDQCPANKFCESKDESIFYGDVFLEWANADDEGEAKC